MEKVNFKQIAKTIKEVFQPKDICYVDSAAIRMAKIKGPYLWHIHKNEDEFFMVISGKIYIDTETETISLSQGEGYLVKKGMKHRSRSDKPATILIIEPTSTKTKGENIQST